MAICRNPISTIKMTEFSEIVQELDTGLSSTPKKLSSKYFYDDKGSMIFQEIMAMPEYYLTRKEHEILIEQSGDIYAQLDVKGTLDVIELGAGDGSKTKILLKQFMDLGAELRYIPLDISQEALNELKGIVGAALPDLDIRPLAVDYFKVLNEIEKSDRNRLFLFLGSNIGNFIPPSNEEFIRFIAKYMRSGDRLLIGVDLVKDPRVILRAYDDSQGITRRFNLNLLKRLNREAGTDFDLKLWDFYCQYNPLNGEVRSFLISKDDQVVYSSVINKSYTIAKHEVIWTELSKKYQIKEIEALGKSAGLTSIQHFTDKAGYFSDSLFKK